MNIQIHVLDVSQNANSRRFIMSSSMITNTVPSAVRHHTHGCGIRITFKGTKSVAANLSCTATPQIAADI
jgi:hypothetical protein